MEISSGFWHCFLNWEVDKFLYFCVVRQDRREGEGVKSERPKSAKVARNVLLTSPKWLSI